ncbi:MAG: hypothetical protein JNK82_14345 [Myxococcaceae bacterium]|nr:hypothetical protein [Myxococcaceae bacterium]
MLDGAATLKAIRRDPKLKGLKVVMMSGLAESMVRRRWRKFDAFLRKPFGLDELLATLKPYRAKAKTKTRGKKPVALVSADDLLRFQLLEARHGGG